MESRQEFISRNRMPRVHITFKPSVGEPEVEIPFVMGVMADLSGKVDPDSPLPPIKKRDFLDIDADNFENRLKAIQPRASFTVKNTLTGEGQIPVTLTFESMDDFLPDAIAQRIPAINEVYQARKRIDNVLTWVDGKDRAQKLLDELFETEENGELKHKGLIESLAKEANPNA